VAHDVFISYAYEDKPVADALCATLEARRIRCWLAPRDIAPGAEWPAAISDAISQSSVFVLIFSDFSNRSQQVIREVGLAVSRGAVVIPLRLENVPLSSTMEYFVSTCHWLDALSPPLEAHLTRLAATIQSLLDQDPAAVTLSGAPVASPVGVGARPTAPGFRGLLAPVLAAATRLHRFCTRLIGRARATQHEPDPGSHGGPPSPSATAVPPGTATLEAPALDADAYREAVRRRLEVRRQRLSARLTIAAFLLVLMLVLAFALRSGLRAHPSETGADGSGSHAAQGGPEGYFGGDGESADTPVLQPGRTRVAPSSDPAVQRERCQSQLKSLARACLTYSMDYDEKLPCASWANAIYPYTMHNYELYECPAARGAWGYALNSQALGQPMATFYQPFLTPMLFDSSANTPSAVADTTWAAYRHRLGDQRGANVAQVDGSVRWYTSDGVSH
jgi:hypothetical protein